MKAYLLRGKRSQKCKKEEASSSALSHLKTSFQNRVLQQSLILRKVQAKVGRGPRVLQSKQFLTNLKFIFM
jgi:hypothetical protein